MYRKIVLAIDPSTSSMHALEQTLTLAASEESELLVVSVVPAYEGDLRILGRTDVLKNMNGPYEEALEKASNMASDRGISIRTICRSGDPCSEVLNLAEQEKADLIVVGKRQSVLLNMFPIGSMASKVIKLSEVDVMIIPPMQPLRLNNIFLAFDGSKGSKIAAEKAAGLSACYGAKLIVGTAYELSVEKFVRSPGLSNSLYKKAEEAQRTAIEIAAKIGVRNIVPEVAHGDPVYKILTEQAASNDAGLIVIGSYGYSLMQGMLLGSVAERVIAGSYCPVLVVKS